MLKEVRYFICEEHEEGKLEQIAQTKFNDGLHTRDSTFFFQCSKGKEIYLVNGTHHTFQVEKIAPYEGKLTAEEIKKFALNVKGRFTNYDERSIFLRSRPEEYKATLVVRGSGEIKVPRELAGKMLYVFGSDPLKDKE